jgi:hypothetical protein
MWTHRTIIVNAAQVELARSLCAAIAGPAGEGMFSTPLSATGLFPATHYISAGLIEDTFAAILPLDIPATEEAEAQRIPGQPEAVLAALPEWYEPKLTPAEVEALFAAIDVTEGDAPARMQTLGLAMCQANSEDPPEEINV